jgi:hypothetical protein
MAMKKKHHSSHHRDGMKVRDSRYDGEGRDAGMDAGLYAERHGGMLHEDHNEMANMPQKTMIKRYPMPNEGLPSTIDDTIAGIDSNISEGHSGTMRQLNRRKKS